jgi:hypothetical protein
LAQGAAEPPLGHWRWFDRPKRPVWGRPNHPQWPKGWFGPPWANRSKFCFWAFGPKGSRTTPWATGGGSAAPRLAGLGVAEPPQAKRGGRPPPMGWFGHPNIFFGFFFLFKKKCDGGILGINRLNGLNCHNLKV